MMLTPVPAFDDGTPDAPDAAAAASPTDLSDRLLARLRGAMRRHPALRRALLGLLHPAMPLLRRSLAHRLSPDAVAYRRWIARHDTLTATERQAMRLQDAMLRDPLLLSVVMPAHETPPALLRQAIDSVQRQIYPYWELCVVDDASPSGDVAAILEEVSATDPRIRWMRRSLAGHIARATNDGIAMARGDFVALMDHDDLLPDHALHEVAALLRREPETELVYSDEDKIDAAGRRYAPYFKPDFDPELLRGQNLASHLGVYSRDLLYRIGGLRDGFAGSQDHDLALRAAAAARRVAHIPRILYHWRQSPGRSFSSREQAGCIRASRAAVTAFLAAQGEGDSVLQPAPLMPSWHRVVHPLPASRPMVSVLVRPGTPDAALAALLRDADWAPLEVLVPWAPGAPPPLADARVRPAPVPAGLSRAAALNRAAEQARGTLLLFLPPGLEALGPHGLAEMAAQASRPSVGAVGASLTCPQGRLLHAGYALDPDSVVIPALPGEEAGGAGPCGLLALPRQVSAVSGDGLMMRRSVFEALGGFDAAALPEALHDVDLCLRLREAGLMVLHTPFAALRMRECPPPAGTLALAREAMRFLWGTALAREGFTNPNLLAMARLRDGEAGVVA